MSNELKPCPYCGDTWIYASENDYGSGYKARGYRVACKCGYAWRVYRKWHKNKQSAIDTWNERCNNG